MHLIYTLGSKFATNFEAVLIHLVSYMVAMRMHLIYTPACKLSQNFDVVLICDSFCFIYGDHACISSILQRVSYLKILMQC